MTKDECEICENVNCLMKSPRFAGFMEIDKPIPDSVLDDLLYEQPNFVAMLVAEAIDQDITDLMDIANYLRASVEEMLRMDYASPRPCEGEGTEFVNERRILHNERVMMENELNLIPFADGL